MNAKVVLIALVAAAAGAGSTFVLTEGDDRGSRRSERAAVDLQRRVEAAEAERAQARAELARLRRERDPQADSPSATGRAAAKAVADPEARKRRVAHLRSQVKVWLETGNGAAVGAALKELAQMNPEGFPLAAELYELLEEDYGEDSKLGHPEWVHISRYTEDTGLSDLMIWALRHADANEDFRLSAVYRLPYIHDPNKTATEFLRLIRTEQDDSVLSTLVETLGEIGTDSARTGLMALLDAGQDPQLRLHAARTLADPEQAEWARGQVIKLAATERDDEVRAVLHAALLAYSPPVTGALVIGVDSAGDGEKAGLRVGDIITRYGGRAVRDHHDLWDEFQARQLETHPIAVALLRDGRELTLPVAPGWLGLTMRTLETR